LDDPDFLARPAITAAVTRGAMRACLDLGYSPLLEVPLANGRRADICGVNSKGQIVIVEVKSCVADFAVDFKWTDYEDFCDLFYFAVPPDFPLDLLVHPMVDGAAPGIGPGAAACHCSRNSAEAIRNSAGRISSRWATVTACSTPSRW